MPGEDTKLAVAALLKVHSVELARVSRCLRDDPSKQIALLAADRVDELVEALFEDFTEATGVPLPLIGR